MHTCTLNQLNTAQGVSIQSLKKRFEDFISTESALPIMGIVVLLFHVLALDMVWFWFVAVYFVLVCFSNAKIQALLPAILMVVFGISLQNGFYQPNILDITYFESNIPYLAIVGSIMVIATIFGLKKRGLKLRLTWGFIGVIALGLSFIFGGLFSDGHNSLALLMGIVYATLFIMFFVLFSAIMPTVKFDYLAKTIILCSLVVCFQIFRVYIEYNIFGMPYYISSAQRKNYVVLGWGISNNVGIFAVLGLPFAAYYMFKHIAHAWAYLVFIVMLLAAALTLSRAVVFISYPIAIVLIVYALIRAKGRQRIILLSLTALAALVIGLMVALNWEQVYTTLEFFWVYGVDGRGREPLFELAIQAFLRYPLFGAGLVYGAYPFEMVDFLFFPHNAVLQFLMWGGLLGLGAYLLHTLFLILSTFKKPNEKRILIFVATLLIILHSMLDIGFFMPPSLIYYMLFVTAIESSAIKRGSFGLLLRQ